MVRYAADHKSATRRRIVERAGARFKAGGIDGSGISAVMGDAGLTNGAFYAHFDSKDALVAEVLADQLQAQRHVYGDGPFDRAGFERFVRHYLSAQHRDNPADGCPTAALVGEVARADAAIRESYTRGLVAVIDDIAVMLPHADEGARRAAAAGVFACMVGALQLSRAISDRALADAVRAQGVANTLALLDLHRGVGAGGAASTASVIDPAE
ncbi:TetR/AcrR family transcriptional regulator [Microbacterium sp. NPDC089189]|uniref:TetR/AcrR family transcriptional regulator n=1 Tax=Microbacterium sp. NPDC089189 TaxID=3154972 RepID=UPI00342BA7BD